MSTIEIWHVYGVRENPENYIDRRSVMENICVDKWFGSFHEASDFCKEHKRDGLDALHWKTGLEELDWHKPLVPKSVHVDLTRAGVVYLLNSIK